MSDAPDAVREALRAALSAWAVAEVRGDQARVLPVPDLDTLAGCLTAADPTWGLSWACDSVSPPLVRARLSLGGAAREGLSGGHTLEDAKKLALADAFRYFGVSSTLEAPWVEYDPDDGPNVSELGSLGESPAAQQRGAAARPLPPQVPLDPQLSSARAHIDTLMEQLREAGKGGEATRLLLRGYGETVAESRAIYKELQALQRR
ncbi:single-stranded DNA-binding protein [Deinococcus alpinitundrae]|uniref:single-stranded DNA-binding protein n=1 Tax=Deinococcus alpinitundrae TaxID=468913 RepID=UPI001379C8DA|nr:single-stranded DNA-binding protein [Deinococcus alpinitundrae]